MLTRLTWKTLQNTYTYPIRILFCLVWNLGIRILFYELPDGWLRTNNRHVPKYFCVTCHYHYRDEEIRGGRADMICSVCDKAKSQAKGWLALRNLYSTTFETRKSVNSRLHNFEAFSEGS